MQCPKKILADKLFFRSGPRGETVQLMGAKGGWGAVSVPKRQLYTHFESYGDGLPSNIWTLVVAALRFCRLTKRLVKETFFFSHFIVFWLLYTPS